MSAAEPHFLYEEEPLLGEGKFGKVHLGVETETGKKIALKIIKMNPERSGAEIQESEICGKLIHCHIIRLFYTIQDEKHLYLIFEYAPHGNLFDDIAVRKFYCEEDEAYCMHQVLDAVAYFHQAGIVHRDLKPKNILLASKENCCIIKIADFGLAVEMNETQKYIKNKMTYGTEGFSAPEILNDEKYAKPVDMFSSGVILYQLLSGKLPFKDNKDIRKWNGKHNYSKHKEFKDVSKLATDLINKMLEKDQSIRIKAHVAKYDTFFYGARGRKPADLHLALTVDNLKRSSPGKFKKSSPKKVKYSPLYEQK